jgi:hypothetical protein
MPMSENYLPAKRIAYWLDYSTFYGDIQISSAETSVFIHFDDRGSTRRRRFVKLRLYPTSEPALQFDMPELINWPDLLKNATLVGVGKEVH